MAKIELRKLEDGIFEIPKTGGMKVPGRIFANESLLQKIRTDRSLEQVQNMAHLPGIYKYAIGLPDIHQGYGFSIGGVAALDAEEGGISPGGVGYDINCGVRLLGTNLYYENLNDSEIQALVDNTFSKVPAGIGRGRAKSHIVFAALTQREISIARVGRQRNDARGTTLYSERRLHPGLDGDLLCGRDGVVNLGRRRH